MPRTKSEAGDVFLPPGGFLFGAAGLRPRTVLGSCVAIVMWHRRRRIGGMCHYVLPARIRRADAGLDGLYAEEAVQLFLDEIARAGTLPGEYEIKLLGGARVYDGGIDVGGRNIEAARRLLRRHGLAAQREHLAGTGHRNVIFDIASGILWLKHVAQPWPLRQAA